MKTIHVDGFVLSDQADGTRTITIMGKTGQIELVFTQETWLRLADSATWFHGKDMQHVQVPAVQSEQRTSNSGRDGTQDDRPPEVEHS